MSGENIRFDRFLPEQLAEIFIERGLSRLLSAVQTIRPNSLSPEYAFDIHIREKSQVMIYHGSTCVLTIDISKLKTSGTIKFVSKSYGKKLWCAYEFEELRKTTNLDALNSIIENLVNFLMKVVEEVRPTFYSNEGFWSSKLSIDFGRKWSSENDWLIFDREAVLGFDNKQNKANFYRTIQSQISQISNELKNNEPIRWGRNLKTFGDELDLLALGKNNQLVCIELKHGSYANGIGWSPLQASIYRSAFREGLGAISGSLIKLIRQKVDLGLLPSAVLDRVPSRIDKVEGIVLVSEPNFNSNCWENARMVNSRLTEPVEIYTLDHCNKAFLFE
jgi:hypothetical protein